MNRGFLKRKAYSKPRDQDLEYDCESSHLLLADGNDSDDDSPHDRNNGKYFALRPKRPFINYIEHALQAGDTLSSLALRYNCSVAQIKQANHILRDNEVFALRKVRVPVSAFSSLRDEVPGIHSSPQNKKKHRKQNDIGGCGPADILSTDREWETDSREPKSDEELHDPLLTPIPLPRLPLVDLSDSEPPDLSLAQPYVREKRPDGIFQCSGADGGISWIALLLCTLVLGFVGPLIYVFFLYEHEQERQLHNHTVT